MADKAMLLPPIHSIKEEDTQNSDTSHGNSYSKKSAFARSHTYSNADLGSSVHSYSEIFESATRESIDETVEQLKTGGKSKKAKKRKSTTSKSSVRQSITWTHKYTTEQIEKAKNRVGWDELVNLEQLHSLKMISLTEYQMRRSKIIDSMTGTKVNVERENKMSQMLDERKNPPQKRILGETTIINAMCDFGPIEAERAIRHHCHIKLVKARRGSKSQQQQQQQQQQRHRYDIETTEEWSQDMRCVKLATNPFTNGTLRYVYYMQDITEDIDVGLNSNASANKASRSTTYTAKSPVPGTGASAAATGTAASATATSSSGPRSTSQSVRFMNEKSAASATHVAKVSIDPMEEYEVYFHDVAMQKHAQRFADEFNKNEVPKKVGFLDCWVYELCDRTPHIFCGVEAFINGQYNKYTNNWDWVNTAVERNTPSAFSHFTYQASNKKILICDLQGVGDLYTDPQMHTYDGRGCGKGNMGKRGMDKFLSSHSCNAICTYLKLPSTNLSSQFTGTLPQKRLMNNEQVEKVQVSTQYTIPNSTTNGQYYGATTTKSMLIPHRTSRAQSESISESDDDDGGYPFGKRLLDDDDREEGYGQQQHEKTKCWCTVL